MIITKRSKYSIYFYISKDDAIQLLSYLNSYNDKLFNVDKRSVVFNNKTISFLKVDLQIENNNKYNGYINQQNDTLVLSFINEEDYDDPEDYLNMLEYFIDRLDLYIQTGVFFPAEFIELFYLKAQCTIAIYLYDIKDYDMH